MSLVSERRDSRRRAVISATIILAFVALLAFAGRAQAAELVYWNNYGAEPDSIGFAAIDGTGGGALNLSGANLQSPEGMAIDPVTGKLYIGSSSNNQIVAANLDGSGATVFSAPGAPVDGPEGVVVDPERRLIFWINRGTDDSISWAKLDGSAGGVLNLDGATFSGPYRLALDPVAGRVYWPNSEPVSISYANIDNTGGGDLNITGATASEYSSGIAVDPAGGRVYWLNDSADGVSYASLSGSGGGDLDIAGSAYKGPYGIAIDPTISRLYWANYENDLERAGGIGFASLLGGGGGGINIATAPFDGPQDPVVLKSPTSVTAPAIVQNPQARTQLSCSPGTWGVDYPGSFVYQSPRSFAYQWTRDGVAVPGATAAAFAATAGGSYACVVTATNYAGSASRTSAAVSVKASSVKLSTKKKAKADPGDLVTFQVKIVNQGEAQSSAARICVKLPKAAKDDLRKPKCKKLAPLSGLARRTAKFRVKVKPGADEGADKLTFQVKGTPGKAAKSKIIVG